MSEITNIPSRKQGKIVGFGGYTDQMLLGMKEDIGLELLLPELRAIRELYRRTLRRDAYLDELYMLDRLVAARRLTRTPINELFTDSGFIADTYADMQIKHSSLHKDAPPTCASLAALPSRYLARAGKSTSLAADGIHLMSGELSDVELRLRGFRTVAYTGSATLGRRDAGTPDIAPAGSLLVLVYPWGNIGSTRFGDALREALATSTSAAGAPAPALDGNSLSDGGIIEWLCERGSGAYIDLSALSPIVGQVGVSGLELLAHPLSGAIIAAMPSSQVNEFMAAVYEKRLWTGIIGALSSDSKLSVNCGPITLSYPIAMLRQAAPCEARAVTIKAIEDGETAHRATPLCRVRTEAGILVSQQLRGNISPQAAHSAAMCAITDCVAGGAAFTDVALSLKISAQPSPDGMSSVLGLLTAIYRVQLEYCCPDMGSSVGGTDDEPSLTVAAAAWLPQKRSAQTGKKASARPTQTVPARVTAPGDLLYLLDPLRTENGFTDHEDARRMWQYVAHLTSDGAVTAAVAVGADGVDAAIAALLGDGLTLSASAPIPPSATPGALLVACREPIRGALLGTVCEK